MKNLLTKIGGFTICISLLFASCETVDFGDENVNPNSPTNKKTDAMITSAITAIPGIVGAVDPTYYVQQISDVTYTTGSRYSDEQWSFDGFYTGALKDLQEVLEVKNAINNLCSIKKEKFKKYLLLGDMLELGQKSKMYHKKLSKVINNSDIDKVFVKGEKTLITYKNLNKNKQGNILQHNDDIDLVLKTIINNNDYLMVKGSNATGLNSLSKKMIKGLNVI